MTALFWQELVLIIFSVVIGMLLGCMLRRMMFGSSTKAAETRARSTTAKAGALGTATGAAAATAVSAPSAKARQAEADAIAAKTNEQLAAQAKAEKAPETKADKAGVAADKDGKGKADALAADAQADHGEESEAEQVEKLSAYSETDPSVLEGADDAGDADKAKDEDKNAKSDAVSAAASKAGKATKAGQKDASSAAADATGKASDKAASDGKAEKAKSDADAAKTPPTEAAADTTDDAASEQAGVAAALAALPKDASAEDKANAVGAKPEFLDAPRGGYADDLKKIKGVGKVLEGKLNGLGVHHYDQIAGWGRGEVAWVDQYLSFKGRVDRENWIPQAKELAGDSVNATGADAAATKADAGSAAKESETAPSSKKAPAKKAPAQKAPIKKKAAEDATAKTEPPAPETEAKPVSPNEGAAADNIDVDDADLNADGDIDAEEERIAAAIAALPKGASAEDKANVAGTKPLLLAAPRGGEANDLKRIKGVGKVIEGKLNDLGIYHFDQIAKWKRKEVNWVTTFLSFKGRVDRENWIDQAKALASGEETEFSKRVDKGEVESSKG